MDCDDVQAAKLELYEEALRNIARGDDGASCHPDTAREALEAAAKI
jgi:hypothetical protein